MNPLTLEWISKAEEDFVAAERLLRVRNTPVYTIVRDNLKENADERGFFGVLSAQICLIGVDPRSLFSPVQ